MTETNIHPAFERAFLSSGGGSPASDCGCGRRCYALHNGYFEPDEFNNLEELRQREPDKYHVIDTDSVFICNIFNRPYVWGCPCRYAETVQQLLWNERDRIVQYLSDRNRTLLYDAQRFAKLVDDNGCPACGQPVTQSPHEDFDVDGVRYRLCGQCWVRDDKGTIREIIRMRRGNGAR
jgi:hypothetical protein